MILAIEHLKCPYCGNTDGNGIRIDSDAAPLKIRVWFCGGPLGRDGSCGKPFVFKASVATTIEIQRIEEEKATQSQTRG